MAAVGLEPTISVRVDLKSTALNHSATLPHSRINIYFIEFSAQRCLMCSEVQRASCLPAIPSFFPEKLLVWNHSKRSLVAVCKQFHKFNYQLPVGRFKKIIKEFIYLFEMDSSDDKDHRRPKRKDISGRKKTTLGFLGLQKQKSGSKGKCSEAKKLATLYEAGRASKNTDRDTTEGKRVPGPLKDACDAPCTTNDSVSGIPKNISFEKGDDVDNIGKNQHQSELNKNPSSAQAIQYTTEKAQKNAVDGCEGVEKNTSSPKAYTKKDSPVLGPSYGSSPEKKSAKDKRVIIYHTLGAKRRAEQEKNKVSRINRLKRKISSFFYGESKKVGYKSMSAVPDTKKSRKEAFSDKERHKVISRKLETGSGSPLKDKNVLSRTKAEIWAETSKKESLYKIPGYLNLGPGEDSSVAVESGVKQNGGWTCAEKAGNNREDTSSMPVKSFVVEEEDMSKEKEGLIEDYYYTDIEVATPNNTKLPSENEGSKEDLKEKDKIFFTSDLQEDRKTAGSVLITMPDKEDTMPTEHQKLKKLIEDRYDSLSEQSLRPSDRAVPELQNIQSNALVVKKEFKNTIRINYWSSEIIDSEKVFQESFDVFEAHNNDSIIPLEHSKIADSQNSLYERIDRFSARGSDGDFEAAMVKDIRYVDIISKSNDRRGRRRALCGVFSYVFRCC